jgi:acetolactate synthase-1/2/3 large subunit
MSGAEFVVRALEDEGVPFAFGIPGAQNLELYDVLSSSTKVRPILVTDEQSASFMADGACRVSGRLCCVNLVPGAGLTHALSGIAEAFMDGVPLLVVSSAVRSDIGKSFQLHDIDQLGLARPVTKGQFHVVDGSHLYSTLRQACYLARTPPFEPVIVEIPANLFLFRHESAIDAWQEPASTLPKPSAAQIDQALAMICASKRPLLYVGVGSAGAGASLVALAERLEAPVATTIQGKGIFPEGHPLSLWCGFGPMAPPALRSIADDRDLTVAIGCRFAEVGTGSYGLTPPGHLIHVDVDPGVFGRNYAADFAIAAEAGQVVRALLQRVPQRPWDDDLRAAIRAGHQRVQAEWAEFRSTEAVSPPVLLRHLQKIFGDRAAFVADSGNGLFEAMECLRLDHPRSFLAPVDFSCMGYAIPAAIGAALAAPDRPVIALEGDGALLMTGLELLTARHFGVPVIVVVLRDRQLAQIAQFQKRAFVRRTSSDISDFDLGALCRAIGLEHLLLARDNDAIRILEIAKDVHGKGRPIVVESIMDDSFRTYFTQGVLRTNFGRLPWGDRLRFVARVAGRKMSNLV